ncbi:N-acetylglucosamine-6-phosphate deacetylase [Moorella naiadis]|uniref:N-acetylglucosamine-6-phosphate deacetylase n=1 Tax=Moorella naiadis (nom. illeg.) TaxID=3093670 RepID=UPI003D9CA482
MGHALCGRVVTPEGIIESGVVRVVGEKIDWVGQAEEHVGPATRNFGQDFIVPGFIDLHVHGADGVEFLDDGSADIEKILAYHGRHGTTSLLATVAAAPYERISTSLKVIQNLMNRQRNTPMCSAQILGVHLEGPFLNCKRAGGQDPASLCPPDRARFDEWQALAPVRLITVAPELAGAREFIRHASSRNVIVSAGHTDATAEQLEHGTEWGLTHLTHFYNAMSGLHHREPGVVGAGLTLPGVDLELIADLVHVHPMALRLAYLTKGSSHIALVTDAVAYCGLPDGSYEKRGRRVYVEKGRVYLSDGTLAGSTLTLDHAVRNMVNKVGVSIVEAVTMASATPARILGIQRQKGRVAPGFDADLVVLDSSLNVRMSMVGGQIIYEAPGGMHS